MFSANLIEMFTESLAKFAKKLVEIEFSVDFHSVVLSIGLEDIWQVQNSARVATIHLKEQGAKESRWAT